MQLPEVESIPLLGIKYLPQEIDFTAYDALVFTSKNAALALDSFNAKWKRVPAYVIAPKTADVVEKLGGNVVFKGQSGHGDEFAHELLPLLKEKRVLFVKAEKTLSSLTEILKQHHIDVNAVTVYETQCNELDTSYTIEQNAVIVFSSPSTIECFFKYFKWDSSYKAVVIGKTTAKYLPKEIEYTISPKTSLQSCIDCAKELAAMH